MALGVNVRPVHIRRANSRLAHDSRCRSDCPRSIRRLLHLVAVQESYLKCGVSGILTVRTLRVLCERPAEIQIAFQDVSDARKT